jgi:hypothetical protein
MKSTFFSVDIFRNVQISSGFVSLGDWIRELMTGSPDRIPNMLQFILLEPDEASF